MASVRRLGRLSAQLVPGTPAPPMSLPHGSAGWGRAGSAAVHDTMGNAWQLLSSTAGAGAELLCTPSIWGLTSASSSEVQPQLSVSLPSPSPDAALACDAAGMLWLTSDNGAELWRFDPRSVRHTAVEDGRVTAEWSLYDRAQAALPAGAISLGRLPSGHASATVGGWGQRNQPAQGAVFGVEIDGTGASVAIPAPELLSEVAASEWDDSIVPWLPFGNHDIHAAEADGKLYVCGGLASGGFPVQYRTYDELFAWDGASDEWVLESKMPERRTYGGWTELEGELWFATGAIGREHMA